jgi:hypothetical protein
MSDFLSRLAQRALGAGPLVRPVIDPIFALAPNENFFALAESSRPASATPAEAPGLRSSALRDARSPISTEPVGKIASPTVDPTELSPLTPKEEVRAAVNAQGRRPRRSEAPGFVSITAPTVEAGRVVARVSALPQAPGQPEEALFALPLPSPTRSVLAVARATLPASSGERGAPSFAATMAPHADFRRPTEANVAAPSRAAPEVVRVTIGRIDVRAELSAPNPRPAPRRPEPARLSLDDYLKQRAEGRR